MAMDLFEPVIKILQALWSQVWSVSLDSVIKFLQAIWPYIVGIAGIQWSKIWSVLRFFNSRILSLWRTIWRQPPTFTGKWLAVYDVPEGDHVTRQTEILRCAHITGNELSGHIENENTKDKYTFGGHFIFDEVVGHYWSDIETRDIGTFKLKPKTERRDILTGVVTLYHSKTGRTEPAINYSWYRYPGWLKELYIKIFSPVRLSFSEIDGVGLVAKTRFMGQQIIGTLKLGSEMAQSKYTISFNGKHFEVKKPWRFLNHSCDPNAIIPAIQTPSWFLETKV
jgi:hypothetical protein